MFVSKTPFPVTIDQINFIFIKQKLNYGEKKRVQAAALKIKTVGGKSEFENEFNVSGYQQQLLIESIISWSGPRFEGRPCTPENIAELDPSEPLLDKVITEISERNKDAKDEDPKALFVDGEAHLVEAQSASATGTST